MMIASPKLSHVRPFAEDDIPQVADVHRRAFNLADHTSPELLDSYRAWFRTVFLNNPWRDEAVGPLVYQEDSGRITGFLGVMPHRLSMKGQSVQVAIMTNFVVDTDSRGMAGMKLLRAFLNGPQDLAVADEASPDVRRLWEGLGGTTSLPQSMHWFYPLRASRFALLVLQEKKALPAYLSRLATPAASLLDVFLTRVLKFPFRPHAPRVSGEDLTCEALLAALPELTRKQSVRPNYDHRSLSWALDRAEQMRRNGCLQKVLVITEKHEIAGCYLYYSNPGGISQVLQIYAKPPFASDVLDHLFHHAWLRGDTVLSGRLEPAWMQTFSEKQCIFRCGPEWALIHSRNPELLNAFHWGDVCFSRLEGEWTTHFR